MSKGEAFVAAHNQRAEARQPSTANTGPQARLREGEQQPAPGHPDALPLAA